MHIPPYLQSEDKLAAKGVDLVVVIASNDPFVMNAWGKVNGCTKDSKVLFMSDSSFSKNHGWMAGMGDRNGRWAAIIEKDGTVSYAENEASPKDVDVSCLFPALRVYRANVD
jgi:alkyl hydroperoxide reductase 1